MFQKLGKFEIKRVLGQGSMGEVYLGVDPTIGREVAIKTILSSSPAGLEAKDRFAREAKAAGLLNHPNLVTIHEFGEDQGVLYIAMEYLKGHDLEELMLDHALGSSESLEVLAQVCDGLAFAHRNQIVHRDIKPSNVRVLRDGKRLHVKVMDFGVARMNNSDMTATGMVMGTVSYMAPEYIRTGTPDPRSDLFAVGVMLYETLSGRKPFSGGTMPTILYKIVNEPPEPIDLSQLHEISPSIRSVLDRALCKDPDQRYQTAEELATALRAAKDPTWAGVTAETVMSPAQIPTMPGSKRRDGLPTAPVAAGSPPPTPSQPRVQPTQVPVAAIVALTAAALLVLLGGAGYGYWRWKQQREPAPADQAAMAGNPSSISGKMDTPPSGMPGTPPSKNPALAAPVDESRQGKASQVPGARAEANSPQHSGGRDARDAGEESSPVRPPSAEAKPVPSSAEKVEPAPDSAGGKYLAWTLKHTYRPSEVIEVVFSNVPENRAAWIDISRADDRDGKYRQYYWTYGKPNGKMTFSGLNLDPGAYEVRVHFSRSNSVDRRFPFRVE